MEEESVFRKVLQLSQKSRLVDGNLPVPILTNEKTGDVKVHKGLLRHSELLLNLPEMISEVVILATDEFINVAITYSF